jgi:hypothetical protein
VAPAASAGGAMIFAGTHALARQAAHRYLGCAAPDARGHLVLWQGQTCECPVCGASGMLRGTSKRHELAMIGGTP